MEKTAVEFLESQYKFHGELYETAIEKAKEMEKQKKIDTSNVTRVEVIQHSDPHNGRAYVNSNAKDVFIEFQDDGRTLKIFLK